MQEHVDLHEFLVHDGRTFEVINGSSFIYLIECILDVGHTLLGSSTGCATDLIDDSRTISCDVNKLYEQRKSQ
ncbi:unnamed protein product [Rotaria sordida]|uniref:Uncharacterized protein n=1 Tax=Rotaria sordida TaxID=392033 RepID=A0A818PBK2_9BILA|nr:unnamed protein product [Rotaria sordida]